MSFPASLIGTSNLIDQNVNIPRQGTTDPVTYTVTVDGLKPSYGSVVLGYSPRSQTTLANGSSIPSTITVSNGGVTFTEVFYLSSVNTPNAFFTDSVNKKLYFFSTVIGQTVTISYSTVGDTVHSSTINNIQNDLNYVESMFDFRGTLSGILTTTTVIDTHTLTSNNATALVLLGGKVASTYTKTAATSITITFSGTSEVSYLILVPATAPAP